MRALAACLLVLILANPVIAVSTGAREDKTLDAGAIDLAVAAELPRFALVVDDAGSQSPVDGPADQDVWFLYQILQSALSTPQFGHADASDCANLGNVDDDCKTPPVATDISADGERMVLGAVQSATESQLVFVDRFKGPTHVDIPGRITDVAIDDAGNDIIIGVDRSDVTGEEDDGRVYWYTWASSPSKHWEKDLATVPTDVAISGDGLRASVAAGTDHYIYDRSSSKTPYRDASFPGDAISVAMAQDPVHITIAGGASSTSNTGAFRIYSDESVAASTNELNVPGSGRITKVAITEDASAFAIGRSSGRLQVYELQHAPVRLGQELADLSFSGAIRDLEFSADGSLLALGFGKEVQLRTSAGEFLWKDTFAADIAGVGLTGDGSHVVATAGTTLRVYDAIEDLDIQVGAVGAINPGSSKSLPVTLSNDGNRVAAGNLSVDGPDWNMSVAHDAFRIMPDGVLATDLHFTPPATAAPGTYTVTITAGDTTHDIEVNVPTRVKWALDLAGQPTSLAVKAGASADFSVTIQNQGNVAGVPPFAIRSTTAQWSSELVAPLSEVAPGASADVVVRLTSPQNAPDLSVGTVRVGLDNQLPVELRATVGATFRLALMGPSEVLVTAGETKQVSYTVKNEGNAIDSYRLRLTGVPLTWQVVLSNQATEMLIDDVAPGASRTVNIAVFAPIGSTGASFGLSAESLADNEQNAARLIDVNVEASQAPLEPEKKSPGLGILAGLALLGVALRRRA